MVAIAPFKGIFFNTAITGDLNDVVSPPYDVLDSNEVHMLEHASRYNMVRLDLAKQIGKEKLTPERYSTVKERFSRWLSQKALIRDNDACVYRCDTEYINTSGQKRIRRGLICRVKLEAPYSEIKPHEKTFESVVDDRLELLRNTQVQFSQIFSLFQDETSAIGNLLKRCTNSMVCSALDRDGNRHSLFRISDKATLDEFSRLFKAKQLYIADGHHRFATAVAYKEYLEASAESLLSDHPASYVTMYLCAVEDAGLTILPTHRLVHVQPSLDEKRFRELFAPYFHIREYVGDAQILDSLQIEKIIRNKGASSGTTVIGVLLESANTLFIISPNQVGLSLLSSIQTPLSQLDVVVLSELVIKTVLGLHEESLAQSHNIDYISDTGEAVKRLRDIAPDPDCTGNVLFLLNPTTIEQLKNVADNHLIMPHKSTYFYPKVLTGLIMNEV